MSEKNDDILASLMNSELGSFMDGKPNTTEESKESADAGSTESSPSEVTAPVLGNDNATDNDGDSSEPMGDSDELGRSSETDESVVESVVSAESDSSGESGATEPVEPSAPVVPASSSVEAASESTSDSLQEQAKDETESKPIPVSESDEAGEGKQLEAGKGATWLLSGLQLRRSLPSSTGWKSCKPDLVEHEEYGEVQLLHGRMGFCAGAARIACGNIALAFDEDGNPFYLTRTNCVFGASIPVVRSAELDKWFDSLDLDF